MDLLLLLVILLLCVFALGIMMEDIWIALSPGDDLDFINGIDVVDGLHKMNGIRMMIARFIVRRR
jgi:hypothetical protein